MAIVLTNMHIPESHESTESELLRWDPQGNTPWVILLHTRVWELPRYCHDSKALTGSLEPSWLPENGLAFCFCSWLLT